MNSTRKKRRLNPTVNSENEEEVIYHNVFYPSFKVHCDFCEKDITRHTKLVDANGLDTDMCVNCFLEGRQNEKHSKNNPYHVINRLTFPLYEDHWSAEEELLLIEGLEKFGFGNWVDIAEHLATDKTPEDVMNHYEKIYMSGKNFLPPTEVLTKRDNKHHLIIKQSASKAGRFNEDGDTKRKKYTKQYVEKKDTSANTATGNNNTAQQPVGSLMQPKDSNVNTSEIVGFMPLRGDFDYEYDNEAELFLAEMEFNDDDKPEEIATKMKILEIYNIRLDERIKRKNFVIERDMLDLKKQNLLDRVRTKEEKEIYNLLKVFARFNTPEEHEKLVQGIYKERMLKKKIEELRFYKKIGLKTFEEVDLYIQEKKKKEEALQKKQKQNEVPSFDKQTKPSTVRRNRGNTDLKEANEKKNKYAQTQLNEKEMSLCDHVCITPHEFLLIKDLLVRECLKEGFLTRDFVDASIKLDFKDKANQVFDFLVTNKVISEKN